MRKITAAAALAITLSLAAPVATFAATSPRPTSFSVQQDDGPGDRDLISRVIRFISRHLHFGTQEQPIIPTP